MRMRRGLCAGLGNERAEKWDDYVNKGCEERVEEKDEEMRIGESLSMIIYLMRLR